MFDYTCIKADLCVINGGTSWRGGYSAAESDRIRLLHPDCDGNDFEAKGFKLYYVSKGEVLRVEDRMMI